MMNVTLPLRPRPWSWTAAVFIFVLAAQLWLVASAGTDVPYQDQWDREGKRLYPTWVDGSFRFGDLFRVHNEHRIVWTDVLDLGLFTANGQWDPLLQLVAVAGLRAALAAWVAWMLLKPLDGQVRGLAAAGLIVAFLPVLPWNNVLWGFQSQVFFCALFSVLALRWLGGVEPSWRKRLAGGLAGGAALLAMGAGAFVPVALLGIFVVRAMEDRSARRVSRADWGVATALLALAWSLHVNVPEHARLHAHSPAEFFTTLARVLAWPHVDQPWAAVALNLPLVLAVGGRILRKRTAVAGEDFALLLGGWALGSALGAAWARGGGDEFAIVVPSRYTDFFILLPIANAWCVGALLAGVANPQRRTARWVAVAWMGFLGIGWLGTSAEIMRRVILPRTRDREAPIRLAREFQRTGDARVFAGQWVLLVPHPDPESVRMVLADPRMQGRLPPSLQPGRPMGFWSRAVRWLLRQ